MSEIRFQNSRNMTVEERLLNPRIFDVHTHHHGHGCRYREVCISVDDVDLRIVESSESRRNILANMQQMDARTNRVSPAVFQRPFLLCETRERQGSNYQ